MLDVTTLTLGEIVAGLDAGTFSSVELTSAYLVRIEQVEPKVQAFITVTGEQALAAAESVGRGAIGGFVSLAAIGEGVLHRCECQRSGARA
ncbi:MAG: Asp-tRNA(Asn)/Glu-tRNA(Gln) amidotransferase GatCAB subunit A, partial [Anaerolineae bacterium]|nr:Asp-tRNA(Asn)/Glu-tRNA(Gln) amidotransferase GatCAB subunit A [Anaerolineae bacterium]